MFPDEWVTAHCPVHDTHSNPVFARSTAINRRTAIMTDKNIVITAIMALPLNTQLELNHYAFRSIEFDITDGEYCWCARTHYNYGGGLTFPMKSTHLVRTFKTLNGAKRNFIKRLYPREANYE